MSTKRDLVKEAAAKAHNMQMEEIRSIFQTLKLNYSRKFIFYSFYR